jgi:hypothetical protein
MMNLNCLPDAFFFNRTLPFLCLTASHLQILGFYFLKPNQQGANFFFFYILSTSILQKYMVHKKFAKLYIWRRGGRRQGPTAVPHGGRRRGRGPVSFQKFVIFLFEFGLR